MMGIDHMKKERNNGMTTQQHEGMTRRDFGMRMGFAGAVFGLGAVTTAKGAGTENIPRDSEGKIIPGFENTKKGVSYSGTDWKPVSDRKIKVGIAGYGLCQFGATWFYQNHPNVDVVAATDLDPARCAELATAVGAKKTYPSCEEMIKDKEIEAIYIATDAPSHAKLAIMALNHGKHVASAVPAVFGFKALEEAQELFEAVKRSGKVYMMNETSAFHADCYGYRVRSNAGVLGKIMYSEGEYYHDFGPSGLGSYNPKNGKIDAYGWRRGLVPMWYPTHATAYHVSATGGRLTEVSALGIKGLYEQFQPQNNPHNNAFGTEIGLFKTSQGGIARIAQSWDMKDAHGEQGRVYAEVTRNNNINWQRPPLPPGANGPHHGASHGYLTNDFIESILLNRKPYVDISEALNMTLAGVVAHQSALKGGEWMKIPQYSL
jgi:predicted dehydrogenase